MVTNNIKVNRDSNNAARIRVNRNRYGAEEEPEIVSAVANKYPIEIDDGASSALWIFGLKADAINDDIISAISATISHPKLRITQVDRDCCLFRAKVDGGGEIRIARSDNGGGYIATFVLDNVMYGDATSLQPSLLNAVMAVRPNKSSDENVVLVKEFDQTKHPRGGKPENSGQFSENPGSGNSENNPHSIQSPATQSQLDQTSPLARWLSGKPKGMEEALAESVDSQYNYKDAQGNQPKLAAIPVAMGLPSPAEKDLLHANAYSEKAKSMGYDIGDWSYHSKSGTMTAQLSRPVSPIAPQTGSNKQIPVLRGGNVKPINYATSVSMINLMEHKHLKIEPIAPGRWRGSTDEVPGHEFRMRTSGNNIEAAYFIDGQQIGESSIGRNPKDAIINLRGKAREKLGKINQEQSEQELDKAWDETQHPRGKPKNAGQFTEKPGGGGAVAEQHAPPVGAGMARGAGQRRAAMAAQDEARRARRQGRQRGIVPPAEPVPAQRQPASRPRQVTASISSDSYEEPIHPQHPGATWNAEHREWTPNEYDKFIHGVKGMVNFIDHSNPNFKYANMGEAGRLWVQKIGDRNWQAKMQAPNGDILKRTGSGITPYAAGADLIENMKGAGFAGLSTRQNLSNRPRPAPVANNQPVIAITWNNGHREWNQEDFDDIEGAVLGGNLQWNDHQNNINWKSADTIGGGKLWAKKAGNGWEVKYQSTDGSIVKRVGVGFDLNNASENLLNNAKNDIDNGIVRLVQAQPVQPVVDADGHFVPQINWKVKLGDRWSDDKFEKVQDEINYGLSWTETGNDEQIVRFGENSELRAWKVGDNDYRCRLLVGGKVQYGIGSGFYPDGAAGDLMAKARIALSDQRRIDIARAEAAARRMPGVKESGEYVTPDQTSFAKHTASPERSAEDRENVEAVISKNDILNVVAMGAGTKGINSSYTGDVKDDGRVVVKPFENRVGGANGHPALEVLAYEISKTVGFSAFPTTVYRNWRDDRISSVQEFSENSVLGVNISDADKSQFNDDTMDSLSQMFLMDIITGNYDRNHKNYMFNRDTKRIVAIDNGFAFLQNGSKRSAGNGYRAALGTVFQTYQNENSQALGNVMDIKIKREHLDAMDRFLNSADFESTLSRHLRGNDVMWAKQQAMYGLDYVKNNMQGQIA